MSDLFYRITGWCCIALAVFMMFWAWSYATDQSYLENFLSGRGEYLPVNPFNYLEKKL